MYSGEGTFAARGTHLVTHKAHRWRLFLTAVMMIMMAAMAHAETTSVPIQIEAQGDSARIIFDFPKLTAYYVQKTDNGVQLKFDTPFDLAVPAGASALIKKTDVTTTSDGMKIMQITSDQPLSAEPRRLKKKIVFTLAAVPSDKPAPAKEDKPVAAAVQKPTPEAAPAKPETPAETTHPNITEPVTPPVKAADKKEPAAPAVAERPAPKAEQKLTEAVAEAKTETKTPDEASPSMPAVPPADTADAEIGRAHV